MLDDVLGYLLPGDLGRDDLVAPGELMHGLLEEVYLVEQAWTLAPAAYQGKYLRPPFLYYPQL